MYKQSLAELRLELKQEKEFVALFQKESLSSWNAVCVCAEDLHSMATAVSDEKLHLQTEVIKS